MWPASSSPFVTVHALPGMLGKLIVDDGVIVIRFGPTSIPIAAISVFLSVHTRFRVLKAGQVLLSGILRLLFPYAAGSYWPDLLKILVTVVCSIFSSGRR